MRQMAMDFFIEEGVEYPIMNDEEFDRVVMNILVLKDDPSYLFLIAYDGKKPIGFMTSYIGGHPYGKPSRVGVANQLYVVPSKRENVRVAYQLVKTSIQWAIDQGVEAFECAGTYRKTDQRWERFGFKPHLTYGHMSLEDGKKFISRRD